MRKRIAYSQNFIKDKGLIKEVINKSSLSDQDIVYEIGVGQGIITEELLKSVKRVVAFEIDKNLFEKLSQRFKNQRSLELKLGNFLDYHLPNYPYKVFSNIPFNITSAIVKKLTQESNSPSDTYIFIQREAAKKFIGKPFDDKNSQIAILLKPWFNTEVIYEFDRTDFYPKPMIDIVLMRIQKRDEPLIDIESKKLYEDFVVYSYNQFKPNIVDGLAKVIGKNAMLNLARQFNFKPTSKPSDLDFQHWQGIFTQFLNQTHEGSKKIVRGALAVQANQQKKLDKIHRTRVDKDWRQHKTHL